MILALMALTIANVTQTDDESETNGEIIWPEPTLLWPEYLITGVSAASFTICFRIVLCNHAYDSGVTTATICA